MVFALAVFLIQPVFAAQAGIATNAVAMMQPDQPREATRPPVTETVLPLPRVHANIMPPISVRTVPATAILKPNPSLTISVQQLAAENRHKRRLWFGLAVASHGTAAFDAWSTRHAITAGTGQELNPLFKPFAGNASMYAAVQVGPLLVDYLGKKMMYSRHGWIRRTWWIPQSASVIASLICGAHNLGVRPGVN